MFCHCFLYFLQSLYFPGMGLGPGFSFSWRPFRALYPRGFVVGSADLFLEFYSFLGSGRACGSRKSCKFDGGGLKYSRKIVEWTGGGHDLRVEWMAGGLICSTKTVGCMAGPRFIRQKQWDAWLGPRFVRKKQWNAWLAAQIIRETSGAKRWRRKLLENSSGAKR